MVLISFFDNENLFKSLKLRVSRPVLALAVLFLLPTLSCNNSEGKKDGGSGNINMPKLFADLSSTESGIDFVNTLEETLESNYYQYMYTYIGGGVAAGDINDDGYLDLYFTSNSSQDKLYLNQGGLSFVDITREAGINKNDGFNTGVTMVDINNDGFQDIYVSRGGWKDDNNKFANLLYINNGDLTFTEKAEEFGLADANRTIQAVFFDYDRDNDLDVYVSNTPDITSRTQVLDLDKVEKDPKTLDLKGSDRLYQNDGKGHFKDVSKEAGLLYDIGFGLNPQVGDLNDDGWLDVYVSNDFNVPDLAYINNRDGTFTESRDEMFKHMSFNSMGSDLADINNDGLMDLMTLDMNPDDYVRSKTTMAMTSISTFEEMVENGYHYQYMHNMLQLNNGNGTFSEIGKMAGMSNTDWSWALLSADFDLDGLNDIFVTNGVYRDVIDQDKNNEILAILKENARKPTDEDFLKFAKMLPQQKLTNFFFKNKDGLTFEDTSVSWVNNKPSFSNGALYADLDNDGDLDIVVNNINAEATILKNNSDILGRKYHLKIGFFGPQNNLSGIGTTVKLYFEDGSMQVRQLIGTRGFLSSVPNELYFGMGENLSAKKMEVIWPDGKIQVLENVDANQHLHMDYRFAKVPEAQMAESNKPTFVKLKSEWVHEDPYFNDFDLQILLPHKLSQMGPGLAHADVNNDGFEDIYLGGGKSQPGQLLLGTGNTGFRNSNVPDFSIDKESEDVGAVFFDAEGDGDKDLYVVSGSYEFYKDPRKLVDRLYLNDGSGRFSKAEEALPLVGIAGSIVTPSDYDGDGDIDLFVGGRLVTGRYPYPASSALLINNKGRFTMGAPQFAPELESLGMVTDAVWTDLNDDGKMDLVVTGEWMGIEIFINQDNHLVKGENYSSASKQVGWWNKIVVEDIDNDGDKDIVAGNLGLNYKFQASEKTPFEIYTSDFDLNGTEDVILAKEFEGKQVPVRGKTCMTQQLPHLAQKIPSYTDFANKDLEGIVGIKLKSALNYKATEFRSGIFINNGADGFSFQPFGYKMQQSPINSILFHDFDDDGNKDLLMAGNNYQSEVETTRADAGVGSFLKGNGKGKFAYVPNLESGFFADKDVRNMILVSSGKQRTIIVANNNDAYDFFEISSTTK